MVRTGGGKKPPLADFHLWTEVADTVLPRKPRRRVRSRAPLPLPPAVPPVPKATKIITMPSYQSA